MAGSRIIQSNAARAGHGQDGAQQVGAGAVERGHWPELATTTLPATTTT
jgi:hypothetical protein